MSADQMMYGMTELMKSPEWKARFEAARGWAQRAGRGDQR